MIDIDPEILQSVGRLIKGAEDNGWNAAINACRLLLPVEYSQRIKHLYRVPTDALVSSTEPG